MDERIRALLSAVAAGSVTVDAAFEELKDVPFQDLSHTKIDHHRQLRKGIQEVIFGEGKSVDQVADIVRSMTEKKVDVLATRIDREKGARLAESFPDGTYWETARCFTIKRESSIKGKGTILIVSAGTSDMPVAEEAYVASSFFGNATERLYDVGVAGIHRLFQNLDLLKKARVIIVAAGMEGALPSIVAGIVGVPVIGIPTSVGYGASLGGFSALLTMLNSCSTVAAFNIDNGFGAAYFATLINRL
ncbi:MAG: AIR carboxylase [Syntrophorhabdaceae bacterium PtaU1.Bin034]|jgi:NCAIR mutase (PurE)-related protein|nr:MAG: AIR carboxylase [Syntrophorhabdaceae bacterium PtaU1.Bin034]